MQSTGLAKEVGQCAVAVDQGGPPPNIVAPTIAFTISTAELAGVG